MAYRDSQNEIDELIIARYPFLYVVADDDIPVIKTFTKIAEDAEENYEVLTWNISSGFFCEHGTNGKKGFMTKSANPEERIMAMYEYIQKYETNAIFVLQDFDFILKDKKHLSFGLKETIQTITLPIKEEKGLKRHALNSTKGKKHIVIVSSTQYIPKELDKLVNLVYFGMPGTKEINEIVDTVAAKNNEVLTKEKKDQIVQSSIGLTEPELTNALFKSIVSDDEGVINPKKLVKLKEQIIKKGGLIEYIHPKIDLSDVGGLHNLMDWVKKRKIAFNETVRVERNLPYPKGFLLTGVQGCGKSHSVKAIASYLGMPLLKLDMGALMGKYVGQSEENARKAIHLAQSIAPAVLWIDEIEKGFPDPRNGNTHEVSNRLLSFFLTWLQEKDTPVFVVATANNIDKLPPELLRKGRFSELFFVDLPNRDEREQIFNIHLNKKKIKHKELNISYLTEKTEGYSGAEIEEIINEANFQSAFDGRLVDDEYLIQEIERTTPISVLRKDAIKNIKDWATKNKVRPAN